jgi:PERQ amino acid-rich with GYF domain-containing protein
MPLETQLLADAVYSCSTTMDGRHFAEEFVRRKKLADKGSFEKESTPSSATESKYSNNGGWNEVAKKGGNTAPKDDGPVPGSSYRVVPAKKGKGKKGN